MHHHIQVCLNNARKMDISRAIDVLIAWICLFFRRLLSNVMVAMKCYHKSSKARASFLTIWRVVLYP
jgi:hypothetical protein